METLKWLDFRNQLVANTTLNLQFQYAENTWVNGSYHITEIKQAPITSVDCGGVLNTWTELIIQLLEPAAKSHEKAMKVEKALSIIQLVEKTLPLNPDGIVKIEFGNSQFDVRQMFPADITAEGENLIINLRPDAVQCKAINRGGSCGSENNEDVCCAPAEKPKVKMQNLAVADCCTPGSGCC